MARVQVLILLTAFAITALPGCQPLEGGAVEVSWQFRTPAGSVLDCRDLGIREVRLEATPKEPLPAGTALREYRFDCRRDVGQTEFSFPPGRYTLTVEPLCGTGATATAAPGASVPAPIERELVAGQLVQLNALLILVPDALACP